MGIALGAMFAWLLAGAPAGALAAGTVSLPVTSNPPNQRLSFAAGAGDTNNVTITQSGSTFTVTDTGAIINSTDCPAGSGTNTVTCTDPDIAVVSATLGNLNDRVEANILVPASGLFGGDGDDTLVAGPTTADVMASWTGSTAARGTMWWWPTTAT